MQQKVADLEETASVDQNNKNNANDQLLSPPCNLNNNNQLDSKSSFFTAGKDTTTAFPMAPKVNLISPTSSAKVNSEGDTLAKSQPGNNFGDQGGLEQVDEGLNADENYEATPTKTSNMSQLSNPPKTKREYL